MLVGGAITILKNMSSSFGKDDIPYMTWKKKNVPNHQPVHYCFSLLIEMVNMGKPIPQKVSRSMATIHRENWARFYSGWFSISHQFVGDVFSPANWSWKMTPAKSTWRSCFLAHLGIDLGGFDTLVIIPKSHGLKRSFSPQKNNQKTTFCWCLTTKRPSCSLHKTSKNIKVCRRLSLC